jgi:hypothetical protein
MMANFQEDSQQIRYKDNTGKEALGMIDDTVRQGNYIYCVGDSQTSIEKKANQEQFLLGLEKFSELAISQGKRLSISEAVNAFGSIHDIENPSKFIEEIPPEQPKEQPTPNQIKDIVFEWVISKLNLPDILKPVIMQEIETGGNIEPPTGAGSDPNAPFVQDDGMAGSMQPLQDENIQQY